MIIFDGILFDQSISNRVVCFVVFDGWLYSDTICHLVGFNGGLFVLVLFCCWHYCWNVSWLMMLMGCCGICDAGRMFVCVDCFWNWILCFVVVHLWLFFDVLMLLISWWRWCCIMKGWLCLAKLYNLQDRLDDHQWHKFKTNNLEQIDFQTNIMLQCA